MNGSGRSSSTSKRFFFSSHVLYSCYLNISYNGKKERRKPIDLLGVLSREVEHVYSILDWRVPLPFLRFSMPGAFFAHESPRSQLIWHDDAQPKISPIADGTVFIVDYVALTGLKVRGPVDGL
jgi:hypothetical protein